MNRYASAFVARFSQESTWRGLVAMAAGLGVVIEPAKADAIIAAGLFIIGTINFAKDQK